MDNENKGRYFSYSAHGIDEEMEKKLKEEKEKEKAKQNI